MSTSSSTPAPSARSSTKPIQCGAGHRPDKLGGYHASVHDRLVGFARQWLTDREDIIVISGLALGWDQALAEASLDLGLETWGYAPCYGHDSKWPLAARARYAKLCEKLTKLVYTYEGPYPGAWCLQRRNERMVDDSHKVAALWNGTAGGTSNCITYAHSVNKPIVNLWNDYLEYLEAA